MVRRSLLLLQLWGGACVRERKAEFGTYVPGVFLATAEAVVKDVQAFPGMCVGRRAPAHVACDVENSLELKSCQAGCVFFALVVENFVCYSFIPHLPLVFSPPRSCVSGGLSWPCV